MECCCCHTEHAHEHAEKELSLSGFIKEYWKPLLSFIMLAGGIIMHTSGVSFFNHTFSLVWYLTAYLPVGVPVLRQGWKRICRKDFFNEFTLMSTAAIGAFYIGDYPEAVSVMLFYSVGELFQERAVSKARRHIRSLLDVRPQTAAVVEENGIRIEHPSQIQVGEVIEIKAGERIPLDGILLGGKATFNTAALTGESLPRTIRQGEEVLSGMIAANSSVRIKVTKPYDQSTLARILDMIQNATQRKAPTEMFITKFAHVYTPIVFGIAVLVVLLPFLWSVMQPAFVFELNEWLYRALVFLVISCPCALVISIPLGYFGGIGAASRQGILFKGGNYLDAITKVDTVVFDKTGTLTKGVFGVQYISSVAPLTVTDLLSVIASVEQYSTHPIAMAIVRHTTEEGIPFHQAENVTELAGYGLKAQVEGKEVMVGNLRLLATSGVIYPQELNAVADTLVACAIEHTYAGYVSLSDMLKEDAMTAIESLKNLHIENIQLLSGDKQYIVTNFAERLGIPKAYGDLLPEGKVEHLRRLKSDATHRVAFVGDGMNDAPVLALSDVGIAMGGLGSDMAIETADVIIQTDQPSKVAAAIRIGRYTRRIVWQNIALAMGVKLAVMILGAGGMATLWEAVFADVGVALLAVLNALRIGKNVK